MAKSGIPHLVYSYDASKLWLLGEVCPSGLYIWFLPSLSCLIPTFNQLHSQAGLAELKQSIKTRTSSSPYVTYNAKIDLLFQKYWLNKMHRTHLDRRDLRTALWPASQREWILLGHLLIGNLTNPKPEQYCITGLKKISSLFGWYTEWFI